MTELTEAKKSLSDSASGLTRRANLVPFRWPSGGTLDEHPIDYERLLGSEAWQRLAPAIRQRFCRARPREVNYVGRMRKVHANAVGRMLSAVCRFVGEPLVALVGDDVPTHVRVYPEPDGGTVWERAYHFPARATRVVRSAKRLDRDGAMVECLGLGLHMQLALAEVDGALHFRSTGYYWQWLGVRIPLPRRWFPGETLVIHRDEGGGRFCFCFSIHHPLFGRIAYQDGSFYEQEIV